MWHISTKELFRMLRLGESLCLSCVIILLMVQTAVSQSSDMFSPTSIDPTSSIGGETSSTEPMGDTQSTTMTISSSPSSDYDEMSISGTEITATPSSTYVVPSTTVVSPSPAPSATKCKANENICKNSAACYVGEQDRKMCFCTGDYYGQSCDKLAEPVFKALAYTFVGITLFLLIIICILVMAFCKIKNNRTGFSKDLDNFNNVGLRAKGKVNGGLEE